MIALAPPSGSDFVYIFCIIVYRALALLHGKMTKLTNYGYIMSKKHLNRPSFHVMLHILFIVEEKS